MVVALSDLPVHRVQELKGHEGNVMSVRFTATGSYALTTGSDRTVKLWNPFTGLCIKTYTGHGMAVNDSVASQDNSRIASGGADKNAIVWDVATGGSIVRFRGHAGQINCIKMNPEATVVVTGSYDSTVKCWDTRSKNHEPIMTLGEAKDSIQAIDVTDYEIMTASVDGMVRIYDLRVGVLRGDYLKDPVTSACLSHDNNCILAATLNNTIRLLDKDTGELLSEYQGHKNQNYKVDVALSYNDAYVVSGSEDGDICFWDLVEAKLIHRMKGHNGVVSSLSFHPKQHALLTASNKGKVFSWKNEKI
eukprot:m.36750 g.36750  ORF g.36750 m.36750 type:complete len:305 (+) comp9181_c0_seq1:82-996(+)